jgi:hypothetical protein
MQASAAGHALTYLITLKLKLVGSVVIQLTGTMFKSLIIPIHAIPLYSTTCVWSYMLYDYVCLCSA